MNFFAEFKNKKTGTLIYKGIKKPEQQIKKHLFIISPNNSGSTLLKNLTAGSENIISLEKEGKNTFGYKGPNDITLGIRLLWASDTKNISLFRNSQYNWESTKKAWYFQAQAQNKSAFIFLEKSPPFLLIPDLLEKNFRNTRFLFLIRNPYAAVEGIIRRYKKDVRKKAANHIINCFRIQKKNIEKYRDKGIFISYEKLCDKKEDTFKKIKKRFPELYDINFKHEIRVKGKFYREIKNLNERQIKRLSQKDIDLINTVFKKHADLLNYFNYSLIK